MANFDPTIPMQFQPVRLENPLDQYARVSQVQAMQQRNRLTDMMFQEREQKVARQNRLMDLSQQAGGDVNKLAPLLRSNGFLDEAQGLEKSAVEMQGLKLGNQQKEYDLDLARRKEAAQSFAAMLLDPDLSYQKIAGHVQARVASGQMDQRSAAAMLSAMPQDTKALRMHLQQGLFQILTPDQQQQAMAPKTEFRDLGGKVVGIQNNPNLPGYLQTVTTMGKTMTPGEIAADARGREANRLKAEENSITKQGIVSKKVQDVELKLQDDWRNDSKGFTETSTAMKKLLGSIDVADKNPGAALAAGTGFMKILDPNSVVRETELGMALNASGWFDRAMNIANTLQSGKVMSPKQKENLKSAAENLWDEAKAAQREIDAAYVKRAKEYGADPARIIVDRGQNVVGKQKPGSGSEIKFLGFE